MKVISITTLLLSALTSCNSQTNYFKPSGIIDKTDSLIKNSIGWTSLNNKESVDGYTRIGDSIFGGEIACNIKPLNDIDLSTFKVLAGTKYAKDKNHIYYPINIYCIDYTDCGVCYYHTIIVDKANPATFRYLSKDYSTDGKNVYFRGKLIEGADGATFKVIDGPEYFYFATDKQNVYKHETIFKEADPATFYYDKNDPRNVDSEYEHKYIIADKSKKWEYIPPDSIKEIK